ncbi:efflux RND transporter periplasmic adaptor subunit [Pseudodesulfovibrio cashew]|uniref:Efflux RND transporter periplasmic adaptor subunit n=1 Tax=Pseudodesulfovibrio cashew TaxID=2678688 RepID=A0A6I6JBQ4_9BACT|nr:efflux RND transporter periplasmic adaptor subunit [Pseudodesulfovibrio cashew]QGY40206.1 efflux RND transporter periplasmic adaptor subunit [Pseudodesulfovibrio cashew]
MTKSPKFRYVPYLTLFVFTALFLTGCGGDEKTEQAAQNGPMPLKVVKAETRDMPNWGEYIGQISAVDTVDVRARVAGFLLEKEFREGSHVKKGDLLFVIDPKTFQEDLKQAQSALQYNQALLDKAKKDQARYKKLLDEGVVSQNEYEGYLTDFTTYQAKVNENRSQVENARIQLGYTKVYSPIDGVIGRMQVDVGNLVGQNESTLLATVSTVDPVYVSFSISETDYVRASRDRNSKETRNTKIKMILADGSEYPHNGTFSMVDRAVDPQTGTLGIRVSFPNPEGMLRPGQYAKVQVLIERVRDAVVVPVRGIIDVQGMKSIYKVGEDSKLVNQPVELGLEQGDLVIVRKGIKAGDMVVAGDIRRIRPGMEVKPIVVPMTKPAGEAVPVEGQNATDAGNKEG